MTQPRGFMADHLLLLMFATFGLVIILAVAGTVLVAVTGASDALFRDAMNIIGIGGPASAATNSAANVLSNKLGGRQNGASPPTTLPPAINLPGGR